MSIVQVFLDPSGPWAITGSIEFDSENGAHLKLPQGASFPMEPPEVGDFFFRTDELKLYRYSGTAWQEQVAAIAAHHASHESGGADSIKLDDFAPPDDNTDLDASTSAHGLLPKLGGGTTNYLRADGTWNTPPVGTLSSTPPVNVTKAAASAGVSSEGSRQDHKHDITTAIASAQVPGDSAAEGSATALARSDHKHSLPAYGTGAGTICQGNDSRLSDDRAASGLRTATTTVAISGATAPTVGQVLKATSSTAATWQDESGGGGNLVKLFQGVDTTGGMTVTNAAQVIALDYETIKDDYYSHSTTVNPGEITILEEGWYRVVALTTIGSASGLGGIRGNPQLHIEIDTGSGFVEQPDQMGGYIREDSSEMLSCSMTGVGLFYFNAGDKMRIVVYDTVSDEPDEETLAYSSRVILEYIDRTGSASGTVENLKDIGDVDADAPNDGDILVFDGGTSEWVAASQSSGISPDRAVFADDFIGVESGSWLAYVSGTGSKSIVTDVLGGQIELSTGATSGSESQLSIEDYGFSTAGNFYFKARARMLETSSLYCEIGAQNSSFSHIAWFSNDSGSSWNCRTRGGGSFTITSGVDTLDTDWHTFEIESTGSSIVFKIDGTTVATHTTNLPSNNMDFHFYMESGSSGAKRMRVDYVQVSVDREA